MSLFITAMNVLGPQPFNPRPIADAVNNTTGTLPDFNQLLRLPANILDSNALSNVTCITLKNLPLIYRARLADSIDWSAEISTRVSYLESCFLSAAAFVHNLVFATIFTALTAVTIGRVAIVRDLWEKYLTHTCLSAGSFSASLIGVAHPLAGSVVNAGLWAGVLYIVYGKTGNEIISSVRDYYVRNRQPLLDSMREAFAVRDVYLAQIVPFFSYLDTHLVDQADQIAGLYGLMAIFATAYERYPILFPMLVQVGKELLTDPAIEALQSLSAGVDESAVSVQRLMGRLGMG